ncbi:MAG: hypothetical protein DWQ36_02790 [Acidobacteria bacterium]|nr:MAG: hypothetical protein DWQ30_02615 [Acidobacteriota bacterium]REK11053.1 MAG: hypothetical protein DWQ36_02790 [Acidobacteriota bacterium]
MKCVTATEGRRLLFRLLDEVERGEEVVLERAGVRFRLSLEASTSAPAASAQSPFVVRDPTLLDGEWSWVGDQHGKLNYRPHGHPSSASGTDRSHDP